MTTHTINCLDCDQTWEMRTAEVSIAIQEGFLKTERAIYGTVKYFGICDACQEIHHRANPDPMEDEFRKLFRIRDELRAAHPEWTLKRACRAAVEVLNNPFTEPNPAFRHYLIAVAAEQVV